LFFEVSDVMLIMSASQEVTKLWIKP